MAKSSNREANVTFRIDGTSSAKANVKELREATEQYGDSGKKAAQQLVDAFVGIEKAEDRTTKKISQGRQVSTKDAALMIQQFAQLQSAVEAAFGNIANAPELIQAQFREAEASVERVKGKVRDLTDAVDDQKGELREGGEAWTGLGDAVNKALGPLGKVQAQMLLVGAAFKEGWSMGMQFNKFIGTDVAEWEDVLSRFGAKLRLLIEGASNGIASAVGLVKAVMTGNIAEIGRALTEMKEAGVKQFGNLKDALTLYGAEWDAVHPKVEAVMEAQRKAQAEAAKLAEAKAKLAEQIRDVAKSLAEETAELEKQRIAAQDAEIGAINTGGQVEYLKRTLDDATSSLAAQKQELAQLTARYGEHDPAVNQARERLQILESQVRSAKESYTLASEELKRYEGQLRAAESAIRAGEEATGKLTQKQGELSAEIEKLVPGYVQLAGHTTAVAVETDKADAAVAKLAESIKKVDFGSLTLAVPQVDAMTAAIERLSAAMDAAAGKAEAMGAAIGGAAQAGLGGGGDEPESSIPPRPSSSSGSNKPMPSGSIQ